MYDICRRFTKLYDAIMDDQKTTEVMKKCNNNKGPLTRNEVCDELKMGWIFCHE